jgi:hypothetical protein
MRVAFSYSPLGSQGQPQPATADPLEAQARVTATCMPRRDPSDPEVQAALRRVSEGVIRSLRCIEESRKRRAGAETPPDRHKRGRLQQAGPERRRPSSRARALVMSAPIISQDAQSAAPNAHGHAETAHFPNIATYRTWAEIVDAEAPGLASRLLTIYRGGRPRQGSRPHFRNSPPVSGRRSSPCQLLA